MICRHEIEGEDYGTCRHCGAMFFRTSGGLWQSYDDGRRFVTRDQWNYESRKTLTKPPISAP